MKHCFDFIANMSGFGPNSKQKLLTQAGVRSALNRFDISLGDKQEFNNLVLKQMMYLAKEKSETLLNLQDSEDSSDQS